MDESSFTSSALLAALPASRGHVSREPKLTDALQGQICTLLEQAIPIEFACGEVGIHETTYFKWRRWGCGQARPNEPLPKDVERYEAFERATTKAIARGCIRPHMAVVEAFGTHTTDDGKKVRNQVPQAAVDAAKFVLCRRYPEHYGAAREAAAAQVEGETEENSFTVIVAPK